MSGIKARHVLLVVMAICYNLLTPACSKAVAKETRDEPGQAQVARSRYPVIGLAKKEETRTAREILEYIKEKAKKADRIRKALLASSIDQAQDQYQRYRRFGFPIPGIMSSQPNTNSNNNLYNDRRYGSSSTKHEEEECDCSDYYYVEYDEENPPADEGTQEYYEDYGPCYDICLEEYRENRDWAK